MPKSNDKCASNLNSSHLDGLLMLIFLLLINFFSLKTTHAVDIPKTVAESARKVVTVMIRAGRTREVDLLSGFDRAQLDAIGIETVYDIYIAKMQDSLSPHRFPFYEAQFRHCKVNRMMKCTLSIGLVLGCAVFVNRADELLMSYQVLKPYVDSMKKNSNTDIRIGSPIAITVFDSSGKILYSPSESGKATIKYLTDSAMSLGFGEKVGFDDDLAIIKLPRNIGSIIPIANRPEQIGDVVFNIDGHFYNSIPKDLPANFYKLADADLFIGKGTSMPFKYTQITDGVTSVIMDKATLDYANKYFVISTARGIENKLNGGPILNSQGEIVGLQFRRHANFTIAVDINAVWGAFLNQNTPNTAAAF